MKTASEDSRKVFCDSREPKELLCYVMRNERHVEFATVMNFKFN